MTVKREILLHPKSPSELRTSFGSGMQPPSVSRPSSVQPIIPCFIISVYSFLIPFLHAFHVSDIRLFHVPHPRSLFHSTSHCIPLVLFLFPLLFPTLCPFPMNPACSLLGSSSLAQVGPLSPALSFCLFVHIPVPDSVPPCVSCVRYSFVSCSRSPIPDPRSIPLRITFLLFYVCFHCCF